MGVCDLFSAKGVNYIVVKGAYPLSARWVTQHDLESPQRMQLVGAIKWCVCACVHITLSSGLMEGAGIQSLHLACGSGTDVRLRHVLRTHKHVDEF